MKFAVIQTGGKQYNVKEGQSIKIEKVDAEAGKPVVFDSVLLARDEKGALLIGKPFIEGLKVVGEVEKQDKSPKVIIFKYKAKKRYRKKTGHRQPFSLVKITKIGEEKKETKAQKKPTAKKKTETSLRKSPAKTKKPSLALGFFV